MRMLVLTGALLALPVAAVAADPDPTALVRDAHLLLYYGGDDGAARVQMVVVDSRGRSREREFDILRLDLAEGGEQRSFVYFRAPADVRRTTFMAWKDPEGDDARWIYLPALDLVKPISASDRFGSFVGSDFRYEDVSGRHWSRDTHVLVGEEELDGVPVWVVDSNPVEDGDGFDRRRSWIAKGAAQLLKQEDFEGDEVVKRLVLEEWEEVDGIWTATVRRMETPPKGSHTTITFGDIRYGVGLSQGDFSERILRDPPRRLLSGGGR